MIKSLTRLIAFPLLIALAACAAPVSSPEATAPPMQPPPVAAAVPTVRAPDAAPSAAPDANPALIASENYPRVDGSTACLPLMALVRSRTTGEDLSTAEELSDCATTPGAYSNIVYNNADLLLVYEPAEETRMGVLAGGDVLLDFTPIGRDALVFITHESNPVESLTADQLIGIYTGKITNWKQVGGDDVDIVAYQREATSGSQALFLKLLMKDTEPMKAPSRLAPGGMGELVEAIASYSNEGNAIGFSVYYYARNMYALPGIKFISVGGVSPSSESIASAEYPFVNDFYVVTRAGETNPSVNALREWITGPEGRKAVIDAGYVPADTGDK